MTRHQHKPPGQLDASTPAGSAQPEPGKATLTGEIPMPASAVTGDKLVDEDLACRREPEGGACFLDPDQRTRILQDGQGRYNAAETHYVGAARIASAEIAERLKSIEDELPIWLTMLLDLAGIGTMLSLKLGKGHIVEAGAERMTKAKMSKDVIEELSGETEQHLDVGIELSVGTAKDAVKGWFSNDAKHEREASTRATQGAYDTMLELLDQQVALIFRALREDAPAEARGDAELLLWFAAADPRRGGMTEAFFVKLIEQKADRFRLSDAAKAGEDFDRMSVLHATRVQWRRDPKTGERRLALLKVDVGDTCDRVDLRSAEFVRWVPDEFEDAAVEIQTARGVEVTEEGEDSGAICPPDDAAMLGAVP